MTRCSTIGKSCIDGHIKCLTHDLWKGLENTIEQYMLNLTLGHVISSSLLCTNIKKEHSYVS